MTSAEMGCPPQRHKSLEQEIESGQVPPFVYTYPPRSAYRPLEPSLARQDAWESEGDLGISDELNLYIHVPFCAYTCGFCNLYTLVAPDPDLYARYIDAVCVDLQSHAELIAQRFLRTVYVGGGTPSLLSTELLRRIFTTLDEIYPLWKASVEEVCIEATPDSLSDERGSFPADLIGMGFTRVNMGVQSLAPTELAEAGRNRASVEAITRAVERVREAGLANLSTDLIMGFNGQTDESWRRSVEALVDLRPDTISTYFLTVRPDARYGRGIRYLGSRQGEVLYPRYDVARTVIERSGYIQESNVRYVLPGRGGYRQKVLQFRGVPVLGIGVGARTYTNSVDYQSILRGATPRDQVESYIAEVISGHAPELSGFAFDAEERARKRLALDLFDLDVGRILEPVHDDAALVGMLEQVREAEAAGLILQIAPGRYQISKAGFKYRDILSWRFFSPLVLARDAEFFAALRGAEAVPSTRVDVRFARSK